MGHLHIAQEALVQNLGALRLYTQKLWGPFFKFSVASGGLNWPPRSKSICSLKSVGQELSEMVWHLHFGWKLRSLGPSEVLTQIYQNSVQKFQPPEWPLLEVRRFFQWFQELSLGILRRFQEKKVHYFFRDFNFCPKFRRLLQKELRKRAEKDFWERFLGGSRRDLGLTLKWHGPLPTTNYF